MATDVERLVVSLEASITKFDRTMNKALGITNNTMNRIERRQMSAVQRMNAGWSGMQRGIATAFASAAALRGAQQLVDASTRIENSLKVVGLSGDELEAVYKRLFASAQRNMAPIETLTTLYSRLGLAQKELGVTNDELLNFTDKVALALRVQGTTAQEARGALIQLSQAMGAGIVRAEEFNSIVEGAPSILRAAAAGLKETNGSVAALRKLVIDGKLSSEAFFRAFEAGAVILEQQVAGAEVTISQGFVRLQNVLIDTAGRFDTATNASSRIGGALAQLAGQLERVGKSAEANAPAINRFLDWLGEVGSGLGDSMMAGTVREFELIGGAIEGAAGAFDRFGPSVVDAELALGQAEQALANFADHTAGKMGEIDAAAQDLFKQVLEGKGSAELAAEAIRALGDANPDFAPLLTKIGETIQQIYALRNAAIAATRPDVTGLPQTFAGQEGAGPRPVAVNPVSLADYKPPETPGGGGRGGRSGADRFADAVAAQERRIAALQRETALQATLNPLVNDYGYAMERLRAQIELENAAKEAGLPLDEKRTAQIEQLADGYATATAEAERLAEAQDLAKSAFDDLQNAARSALDTIIDGFLEGKDAGEIFSNVLRDLGKQLLNIGINMLISGFAPGGNLLGGLFGGRGFATGTANTGGRRGEPRGIVHGQEAVIPLPSGGRVPVDLRMPSIPSGPASAGGEITVTGSFEVVNGNLVPVVSQISGQVAGQQIKQNNKQLPALMRDANQRYG